VARWPGVVTGGSIRRGHMLPPALHAVNEGLAFGLELLMLAGLCWWGAAQHASVAARIGLAVAAPAVAVIAWSLFAAPKARIRVPLAAVLAVKVVLFGAAATGVYAIGQHVAGVAFGIVALVNTGIAAADRHARAGAPGQLAQPRATRPDASQAS
jgi:Protein of unknown function (DUF2568)